MITGIASLVEGERRRSLSLRMWLVHFAGGAVGGGSMAAVVWLAFTPLRTLAPREVSILLTIAVGVVTALADLNAVRIPRQPRQVPQSWFATYGPVRSYGLYGLWLGAGLLTNVTYAVEYVVFIGAGLLLPLGPALMAGAIFGLGRTMFVGPLGLLPRLAWSWAKLYRNRQRGLSGISSAISIGISIALLLVALF